MYFCRVGESDGVRGLLVGAIRWCTSCVGAAAMSRQSGCIRSRRPGRLRFISRKSLYV